MLNRAQEFYALYQTPENINLGTNFYLLNFLIKRRYISFADDKSLRDFIAQKLPVLKAINPLTYITQNEEFQYSDYLSLIDEDNQIEVANGIHDVFVNLFKQSERAKFLKKNFQFIGFQHALLFDLNIPCGRDDYNNKLQQLTNKSPREIRHQLDHVPMDAEWSYTQFNGLPLFAFQGFKEKDNQLDPTGFFYEAAKNNIHEMVAIGLVGDELDPQYDFSGYFFIQQEYIKKNELGEIIRKVSVSLEESNIFFGEVARYKVKCDFETYNPETKTIEKKSHTFFVINIPISDGSPLQFGEKFRFFLYNFLIQSMKQGNVGVHCRAGRGRTVELIAELVAILTSKYMNFFADNIPDNILAKIREFITTIRDQRAGGMLELSQMSQFLINVHGYLVSVAKYEYIKLQKQQAEAQTVSLTQKKQKLEGDKFLPVNHVENQEKDESQKEKLPSNSQRSPFLFKMPDNKTDSSTASNPPYPYYPYYKG